MSADMSAESIVTPPNPVMPEPGARAPRLRFLVPVALFVVAAGVLVAAIALVTAQQPPKGFVLHEAPKPVPAFAFEDDQGRARSLAGLRGKVVLLNIWATWCAPCRREMPSLDRLQGMLGSADFEVVALSIDRTGLDVVRKFYADTGLRNLAIHWDSSGRVTRELGAVGVPTTLLIDREGREIGRLMGPAEWDSLGIVEFLRHVVSRKSARPAERSQLAAIRRVAGFPAIPWAIKGESQ